MQLILHSFFYLKLLFLYEKKIISLLFILALQHNLYAQKVEFDSPEGWGMSYMTAASLTYLINFLRCCRLANSMSQLR